MRGGVSPAFDAAKHGIAGFTKTVALELAQTGITCNAICPGGRRRRAVPRRAGPLARPCREPPPLLWPCRAAREPVHPCTLAAGYVLTDLVRNQLKDTAKARGISEAEVVDKVRRAGLQGLPGAAGGAGRGGCSPAEAGPAACRSTSSVRPPSSACLPGAAPPRGQLSQSLLLAPLQVLLADQPTKQFVKPEDVAALVLHLCGPHSSSFTGACLSIDGGWTAR